MELSFLKEGWITEESDLLEVENLTKKLPRTERSVHFEDYDLVLKLEISFNRESELSLFIYLWEVVLHLTYFSKLAFVWDIKSFVLVWESH